MNPAGLDTQALIHRLAPLCRVATAHDTVLNSECAFTFHSPFTTSKGIVVNLQTFVGTVDEYAFQHSLEQDRTNQGQELNQEDGLFVRIVKQRIAVDSSTATAASSSGDADADALSPATQFITKLGIGIEGGFQSDEQKYDTISTYSIVLLRRLQNGTVVSIAEFPHETLSSYSSEASLPHSIRQSADSIIHHAGMAVQQDLIAWELDQEPKPTSKYAQNLPFVDNGITISPHPSDWKVCFII